MTEPKVPLFSYGTLQQPKVQHATYGRLLEGSEDSLSGYRLTPLRITDPAVVKLSGKPVHSIARATGDLADRIKGVVFLLTEEEMARTDAYEVDAYTRVEVRLDSGQKAFVYAGPPAGSASSPR